MIKVVFYLHRTLLRFFTVALPCLFFQFHPVKTIRLSLLELKT